MRPMRLAFVHPSLRERGGAENYLISAAHGLSKLGHSVHIVTADYDETYYPRLEAAPYQVVLLGGRGYFQGLSEIFATRQHLRQQLRGYDLIIPVNFPAHLWTSRVPRPTRCIWLCLEPKRNIYPKIMYAEASSFTPHQFRTASHYQGFKGLWRLLTRDPHVLLPYSARALGQRIFDQLAVRRVDHILTHSPYTAEKIRKVYAHKPVEVIWAGVPLPKPQPPSEPQPQTESSAPIILVPTRLEPIKNVANVLLAIGTLQNQGSLHPYRVVVMGTGSEEANLRQLALEAGLEAAVTFTGFVSDSERESLYQRCAMVVYPALAEPLGLPCIEAGLHQKPVIASDAGGPSTIIVNQQTGLLVNMSDPQAIAGAIAALIADPEGAAHMGHAAEALLRPRCGLEAWAKALEATLLKC